jgi:hypothetical protein
MKEFNVAKMIIGIRIIRSNEGLILTRSHYVEKILKYLIILIVKPMFTSFDTSIKHFPNTGRVVDQLEYPRVIGYLMYAMTCIRPDFIFCNW